jgi:hypothetical protein
MEMLQQNDLGEMWIAKIPSGDSVSAIFVLHDGDAVHEWVLATDPKFLDTGVASLIKFETFLDHQKRGFRTINVMGGNIPRISSFVSGFNPHLVPYYAVVRVKGIGKIFNLSDKIIQKFWN